MKKIFNLTLVLLFLVGIASPVIAHAEDFLFETTLVKQSNKTYTPPASTCAGDAPPVAVDYVVLEVMKNPDDFTKVSFVVFYTDNLATPLYSFLDKTPAEVNFTTETGHISYTLTGIAKTRKSLTVKVFLNSTGTGSPLESKEFFTSPANTAPPIGTIVPYYGSAASVTDLNLGGWFLCDGSPISGVSDNVLYPDEKIVLQAIIGSANFPDLRGLFLRGTDPLGTYDPTVGRAIGNIQSGDVTGHTHTYQKADTPTGSTDVGISVGTIAVDRNLDGASTTVVNSVSIPNSNHAHSIGFTTTATSSPVSGGAETRPVNAAVNYIIKVRY